MLNEISLNISAGQRVGIVGPDDRQKQALLSLFSRFVDPSDGEVRIDGRNIRWVTHESLRAQIGLITQDRLIFNDTIVNNIGCGDSSFTTPQIIEAAKLAHAHQFIQKLPYGYETPIGELGHSLRIGEQFRIALARAILRPRDLHHRRTARALGQRYQGSFGRHVPSNPTRQNCYLFAASNCHDPTLRSIDLVERREDRGNGISSRIGRDECAPTNICTTWNSMSLPNNEIQP